MAYYDNRHRDDPEEWEARAKTVMPQRTGMTVYSLQLPTAELAALKTDADAHGIGVADLMRRAIHNYLAHRTSRARGGATPHA